MTWVWNGSSSSRGLLAIMRAVASLQSCSDVLLNTSLSVIFSYKHSFCFLQKSSWTVRQNLRKASECIGSIHPYIVSEYFRTTSKPSSELRVLDLKIAGKLRTCSAISLHSIRISWNIFDKRHIDLRPDRKLWKSSAASVHRIRNIFEHARQARCWGFWKGVRIDRNIY